MDILLVLSPVLALSYLKQSTAIILLLSLLTTREILGRSSRPTCQDWDWGEKLSSGNKVFSRGNGYKRTKFIAGLRNPILI